jgi:hypothetical protein
MAKSTQDPTNTPNTVGSQPKSTDTTAVETKIRKKRTPGVKYKTQIPTASPKESNNPLDQPAIPHRGGFKFPGVKIETTLAGCIVKIPAKGAYAVRPTIREVFMILQGLFDA